MHLLIFIFSLIAVSIQAWEPRISPPANQLDRLATGTDLYLVCQVKEDELDTDIDDVEVSWFKNGDRMTKQKIRKNGYIQASLAFVQPSKKDSGEYTCRATADSEVKEMVVNIIFYERAGFTNTEEGQHPEDDKDAEITCETKGDRLEEIFWLKNGYILTESDERGYKFTDNDNSHVLSIPAFDSETDDGNYTCNVVQFAQIYMKEIMVTAFSTPVITVFEIPEGNFGFEGQNAVFKCQATGKPTATYTWYKHLDNGHVHEISSGDKYNVEDGLLRINYLTDSDAGDYSCTASNQMGNATQAVKLSIHRKPRINGMDDIMTDLGTVVELVCKIDSESDVTDAYFMFNKQKYAPPAIPTPSIVYETVGEESAASSESTEKLIESNSQELENQAGDGAEDEETADNDEEEDGADVNIDESTRRKRRNVPDENIVVEWRDKDLVLRINNVQMSHMGKYACHAQNMAGYGHDGAKILVKHRPVFHNVSNRYIRHQVGDSASLHCQVSSVPVSTLKLEHEGSKVYADGTNLIVDQTDDKIVVSFGSLRESDFGTYKCTAKNSEGAAEPVLITLIKIEQPKMPETISCTEQIYPNYAICQLTGYTDKRGEWPSYFEIYHVQSMEQPETGFDWESEATIVEANYDGEGEIRIPGLAPRSNYFARFRAVNEAGRSDISGIIQFETTTPWTPEPVIDAVIDCPDVCSVNWTAPNDRGSSITGYKLVFKEIKQVEPVDEAVQLEMDEAVTISSSNSAEEEADAALDGDDENTENIQVKNEESESSESSENEIEEEANEIVIDVGPSNTHVDLPQLLPLRNYQLMIYAQNDEGDSQPSEYYFRTTEHSGLATLFPLPNWFVICIVVTLVFLTACAIDAFCCKTKHCGILACVTSHFRNRRNRSPKDIEQGNPTTENRGLLSEKHQND